MKKIFCMFFVLFIFAYSFKFSASSFTFDGKDTGIEWDGATVYSLVDGDSNCGVSFGAVKVKFDYDSNAVCMCFYFTDSEFTSDNPYAGVSLCVEEDAVFEISASDGYFSENISPYSFEGAVFIDDNKGATCELKAGIKSGLPESIDFEVRFIDSHGYYSNYYNFSVINEAYVASEVFSISPTADNTDIAYNTDYNTTKKNTVKKETANKKSTKKSFSKTFAYVEIKTSPPYSYTGRTFSRNKSTKTNTTVSNTVKTTKHNKIDNQTAKTYYEKIIYISEVYITESNYNTTDNVIELSQSENTTLQVSDSENLTIESSEIISLSDGTKYKKLITAAVITAFAVIAFFGTYSAKKSSKHSTDE